MFCPNCGADCGSGRFCSACGAEVRQAGPGRSTWVPGMPCPQCGGTELEGKRCAFCGLQLLDLTQDFQETPAEEDSFEIPVGKYYFSKTWWLGLEEDTVAGTSTFWGKPTGFKTSYDQIIAVQYFQQSGRLCGKLCIRWNECIGQLLGKQIMATRRYSFVFQKDIDKVFYHIYYLLKSLAPPTAECNVMASSNTRSSQSALAQSIDLKTYFARYNPYRSQAVIALCKDTGMELQATTVLIDNLFDSCQEKLYAEDPKAAVRDLNRIIRRTAGSWIQLDRAGKGV